MSKTHITWSTEEHEGKCPECETATVLVVALAVWKLYDEEGECDDTVTVNEEVSGHWCPECERLVSLSLNT